MIKTILFDLDGTLLPMDQECFTKGYFSRLVKKIAPLGYEPQKLIDAVWRGTAAMVKNDGTVTNEEAFWLAFCGIYGDKAVKDRPVFDEYYVKEFMDVKNDCGFNERSAETVKKLKDMGFRLVLATNPIFPATATEGRIKWAGLDRNDFLYCSTYENSHYCKPNPKYYKEILNKLSLKPEECLMVGNDVTEDTAAEKVGIKVFLLIDCLINKDGTDISRYPHGSFDELMNYITGEKL